MRSPDTQSINILAVDDDTGFCRALCSQFSSEFGIQAVHSASEALRTLAGSEIDLLFLDIGLPDISGMDLLKMVRDLYPQIVVIMLTGSSDMTMAVHAIKSGAFDYVVKGTPNFEVELRARIFQAQRHLLLMDRTQKLEQRAIEHAQKHQLIGDSPEMLKLKARMRSMKGRKASVVITGGSGTGKEVLARNLSYQEGLQRPFVAVNCGAIPENLFESELFGHEKGAFTGATQKQTGLVVLADGGDLFLDEIGELPLIMQVKLLRALQERVVFPVGGKKPISVEFRLIAATNRDLAREVRENRFREDLYYRISVVQLRIPSLREHARGYPSLGGALPCGSWCPVRAGFG